MTKQEAIEAMVQRKKVTHDYFGPEEWMTSDTEGSVVITEDCYNHNWKEFWGWRKSPDWNDGYSLFPEQSTNP